MIDDSVYSDGEIDLALFISLPSHYPGCRVLTESTATFSVTAYKAHILTTLSWIPRLHYLALHCHDAEETQREARIA